MLYQAMTNNNIEYEKLKRERNSKKLIFIKQAAASALYFFNPKSNILDEWGGKP